MKIKSETFLRLSLLFPYFVGAVLIPIADAGSVALQTDPNSSMSTWESITNTFSGLAGLISGFYLMGAVFWLIPYTVLTIILWLWSRNKTEKQIIKRFMWSPVYLSALILAYSLIITFFILRTDDAMSQAIGSMPLILILPMNVCALPLTLVVGYIFISIVAWIHGILRRMGMIMDEELNLPIKAE